jgi:hypothetical protein
MQSNILAPQRQTEKARQDVLRAVRAKNYMLAELSWLKVHVALQ